MHRYSVDKPNKTRGGETVVALATGRQSGSAVVATVVVFAAVVTHLASTIMALHMLNTSYHSTPFTTPIPARRYAKALMATRSPLFVQTACGENTLTETAPPQGMLLRVFAVLESVCVASDTVAGAGIARSQSWCCCSFYCCVTGFRLLGGGAASDRLGLCRVYGFALRSEDFASKPGRACRAQSISSSA